MRTHRRPITILIVSMLSGALALGLIGQAGAAARRSPRAHAASSYLTGVGDQHPQMFSSPLWQQLHTKITRYVVPYDTSVRPYYLQKAQIWIHAAEAEHQQVLVAFYHSEYTDTRMPSVATYQHDVQKFVRMFPHVHQYQAWNEADFGDVRSFSSPSAVEDAKYYQALLRVCKRCTVIGLDVLDENSIAHTLRYISEFKLEIRRLETIMPTIWGVHNYSDINRLEGWRTRDLVRALGGQVWLTETGGLVKFEPGFPNRHGEGLTRAAKVLKFMFAVAAAEPRIKRVYIYDWTGGTASTSFDAGLTNAKGAPRAGYVAVCRQLHGAHCSVKVADN
jgi:hypothetical protein